jgi:hypothetical protein
VFSSRLILENGECGSGTGKLEKSILDSEDYCVRQKPKPVQDHRQETAKACTTFKLQRDQEVCTLLHVVANNALAVTVDISKT